ncbi:unnamed protein product [Prunus armeniaca]
MRNVSLPRNEGSSTSTSQIVTIKSDNSLFPAGITLIETNYALWSQVMEKPIATREKLGYLTSDTPKPLELSFTYNKWCTEKFWVKMWLIDSTPPDLMSLFTWLSTAKEIWVAVKKTYYDGGDETYLFHLNKRVFIIKQNGAPIHKYYSQLQGIFQEIDHRRPIHKHCAADVTEHRTKLDRLRQ